MNNPRTNPDGYACPSCKQLLKSDDECTALRAEVEKLKVISDEELLVFGNAVYNSSEVFDPKGNTWKERADKAEAGIQARELQISMLITNTNSETARRQYADALNAKLQAVVDAAVTFIDSEVSRRKVTKLTGEVVSVTPAKMM